MYPQTSNRFVKTTILFSSQKSHYVLSLVLPSFQYEESVSRETALGRQSSGGVLVKVVTFCFRGRFTVGRTFSRRQKIFYVFYSSTCLRILHPFAVSLSPRFNPDLRLPVKSSFPRSLTRVALIDGDGVWLERATSFEKETFQSRLVSHGGSSIRS